MITPDQGGDHRTQILSKPCLEGDRSDEVAATPAQNDHFSQNDHLSLGTKVLNKGGKRGSKVDTELVSPIEQLFNSTSAQTPETTAQQDSQPIQHSIEQTKRVKSKVIIEGALVRYAGRNFLFTRMCGDKQLTVESVNADGEYCQVNHAEWLFPQTVPISELKAIRR
jgi:hypothetical protein